MMKQILSDQDVEDMDGFDTAEVVLIVEGKVLEAVVKWMEVLKSEGAVHFPSEIQGIFGSIMDLTCNHFKKDFEL